MWTGRLTDRYTPSQPGVGGNVASTCRPFFFRRLTDSILQLFRCPPSPPTFNIGMTPSCTLFILIFDGPGPGDAPILNVGGAGGFTARTVARLRPSTGCVWSGCHLGLPGDTGGINLIDLSLQMLYSSESTCIRGQTGQSVSLSKRFLKGPGDSWEHWLEDVGLSWEQELGVGCTETQRNAVVLPRKLTWGDAILFLY